MVPARGDAHKIFHSLLVGIRSRTDSSACENVIKISHPRKRRFSDNSRSWFPQAEMHIKMFIPPLREYNPEPTVPLAEMQSKYRIPASGDLVIIHVHGSRKRRCSYKFSFPLAGIRPRTDSSACGNAIKISHPRKRRFSDNSRSWFPQAEMHIQIFIPPCGNTIQN